MAGKGKEQLHWSAIDRYLLCGEQFRRIHKLGERVPPGIAAPRGTGVHKGVDKNLQHKMVTGELLTPEEISDITRDATNEAWEKGGVLLTDEEKERGMAVVKGETVDQAIRLGLLHHEKVAPSLYPLYIEYPWVLELRGFPFDLAGRMDIIETTNTIRDTKTKGKQPPAGLADKSGQLTTYAFAWQTIHGGDLPKLALDFLVLAGKTPTSTQYTTRTKDNIHALLRRIEVVAEGITKEVFIPTTQDSWICNPRYCGFFPTCKYVK